MSVKALDLFQAYTQEKLPRDGGFIVSSFFDRTSAYSIYEIVAYSAVKSIHLAENGITFQTDGNKLFVLVEPPNYPRKHIEPVGRGSDEQIPYRFSELEIHVSKNQTKVMVSREPLKTYAAFTILKPSGINFALIFYSVPEINESISFFFAQTLHKEAGVPSPDAKKAAELIQSGLSKFTLW